MAGDEESAGSGQGIGPGPGIISTALAAKLLMLGTERVRQLVAEGWINKVGKDQYQLIDVVQGYIRFRDSSDRRATKSAASNRVSEARAREVEMRTRERERRLIEIDDVMEAVEGIVGVFLSGLSGLPARATRDLQLRRTFETACNELRSDIAATARKRVADLGARRVLSAAIGDHGAGSMGDSKPEISENSVGPGAA